MPHGTRPRPSLLSLDVKKQMGSLQIRVLKSSGATVLLDLFQKEAVQEVLDALSDGGYVVLKCATDLNRSAQEYDILSNRVRIS